MNALRIVTGLLCLLVVPTAAVLFGTARRYLDTTADIAAIRIEIGELRPVNDQGRALAGPDISLRVYGVAQSTLTLAEINFVLLRGGQRAVVVATFPRLTIPRGGTLDVTVQSSLDPARAAETRAAIAAGARDFLIDGNARVGLPGSDVSVVLTLSGPLRAAAAMPDGAHVARCFARGT